MCQVFQLDFDIWSKQIGCEKYTESLTDQYLEFKYVEIIRMQFSYGVNEAEVET